MASRLDRVTDWEVKAGQAAYQVARLAALVGVTRRQLNRYFAERFHLSPKAWLGRQRMLCAVRLLEGGWLIKEISGQLGYKHPTHFSGAFARAQGSHPRRFLAAKIIPLRPRAGKMSQKRLKCPKNVRGIPCCYRCQNSKPVSLAKLW